VSDALAPDWLAAVANPAIARELETIYAKTAAAIVERKPVCVASGRCCHFEAHGHRLYVTGLEAAYTVSRATGGLSGEAAPASARLSLPILNTQSLSAAHTAGTCPYLSGTLCTVHSIKPLACRTYYCDPTAQEWQHELTERLLGEGGGAVDVEGTEAIDKRVVVKMLMIEPGQVFSDSALHEGMMNLQRTELFRQVRVGLVDTAPSDPNDTLVTVHVRAQDPSAISWIGYAWKRFWNAWPGRWNTVWSSWICEGGL